MSEQDCLCGCRSSDYPGPLVDRAIAEQPLSDEPTLMNIAMRLGRGHYNPQRVLDEIRSRDLFSSRHATWTLSSPTLARWP